MGGKKMFFVSGEKKQLTVFGGAGVELDSVYKLTLSINLAEIDIYDFTIDPNNNVFFKTKKNFTIISSVNLGYLTYVISDNLTLIGTAPMEFQTAKIIKAPNLYGISTNATRKNELKFVDFPSVITTGLYNNDGSPSKYFIYENALNVSGQTFILTANATRIRLPKVVLIGNDNTTTTNVFGAMKTGVKIYVNPFLMTCNMGGLEADLLFAQDSRSATIISIINTTKPNAVNDLSASSITSSGCDLSFTSPLSLNTLDFYEVWAERLDLDEWDSERVYTRESPLQEISVSGQSITGFLSGTSYKIKVVTCDIYWNRSEFSNEIIITTL